MRIKQIIIKNYKNIGIHEPCIIVFPEVDRIGSSDFLTIIGENNIGKSSILEALQLFLPETGFSSVPSIDMFPFKKEPTNDSESIEIAITFNDFNALDREHPYIKPYIYNEEMVIKRVWKGSTLKDSDVPFEVYTYNRIITELNMDSTFNQRLFDTCSPELKEIYEEYCSEFNPKNGTITAAKKDHFVDYIFLKNFSLITELEPTWFENPNGLPSKLRTIMPRVIYVPAVKLINEEADANKNKSAANQIASALFEHHLNESDEIGEFKRALDGLKNIFSAETRHTEVNKLEIRLSKKLKRLMEIEASVDFEVPEVMEKLHLNSSIFLKYNNLLTKPSEQGNGVQRMLILSLLELMAEQLTQHNLDEDLASESWKRSLIFLVEEPEIYLHPHLQRKMRDSLVQISKHPLAQVACTSHSENFIDLADRHQGVVLVQRRDNGTAKIIQVTENIFDGPTKTENRSRMRMLLNFNASTLEAFFAKRVILVEGDCEVASILAIKQKLSEIHPDSKEIIERKLKEITVIPCNGKLTQLAYLDVLLHFGINPFLIHDLDGFGPNEGTNLTILNRLGSEERRLTHEDNFENDIFNETWERDKPWKALEKIQNDFEEHSDKLMRFFKFILGEESYNEIDIEKVLIVGRE
jgi:putative ATP-dependent endonuclease of the OLD family